MARIRNRPDYEVQIHGVDTLEDCKIWVTPYLAFGTAAQLDQRVPSTIIPFLKEAISKWEGFDALPCNEEGFNQLTLQEVMALANAAASVIVNPPTASNSNGS